MLNRNSMSVARLTYEEFAVQTQGHLHNPFDGLVHKEKTVYVYALTRDLCSGCETQKSLFEELARKTKQKYDGQVEFNAIHVSQQDQFRTKLQDFRRMLGFAAYPTYLVMLKAEFGMAEIYRGVEPPMDEIARSIDIAIELANR